MKISKVAAYSLHALMYMVRHSTVLPVTADTVAKTKGIPFGYLAKILKRDFTDGSGCFVKVFLPVFGREKTCLEL